jgi:hypothetical protein
MNKIYGFGDSYTEGQPDDCTFPPFLEWKKIRGGTLPKCWLSLLGEKLNMDSVNYAVGGKSNDQIFDDVCERAHLFNKGDIVIVNWTYRERFRWPHIAKYQDKNEYINVDKNGNPIETWRGLSHHNFGKQDFYYISESTRDEIINTRLTFDLYSKEIYNRENLLEMYANAKGFEIYFWSTDDAFINRLPKDKLHKKKYLLHEMIVKNEKMIGGDHFNLILSKGGLTIFDESDGLIHDIHFGESGHIIQAEMYYEYLKKHSNLV